MIRIALVAAALAMFAAAASSAAALDERTRADLENKVQWITEALDDGSVPPQRLEQAFFQRGHANQLLGNDDAAIADYTAAIHADPTHADSYSNRGVLFHRLRMYERAIVDFDESIRLAPNQPGGYVNRGLANWRLGKYDVALADYDFAVRLKPDYALAQAGRGFVLRDSGRIEEAVAAFGEAIRLDPQAASPYRDRAAAYRYAGRSKEAVADCSSAIRLDPDEESYACRGTAYFDVGDLSKAEADFRRSLAIEPCQPEILLRLLVVAKKNGNRIEHRLFCQTIAAPEAETWPAPLLAFLLGTAPDSRKKLEAGLFPGGGKTPVPERHCESSFFLGEAELAVGATDIARTLLQEAEAICSVSPGYRASAHAELARMQE